MRNLTMRSWHVVLLLTIIMTLFAASGAAAQAPEPDAGGLDQALSLEVLGQLGGEIGAVAAEGDYAYVNIGPRLAVLNMADPSRPALMGQTTVLAGRVRDICLSEGRAYVAAETAGLYVIDVSDPTQPAVLGHLAAHEAAFAVAAADGYAYVTDHSYGLRIVNVANPSRPVETGSYGAPGPAIDVTIAGSTAYLVAGFEGLHIIDVSDKAAPALLGLYKNPHFSAAAVQVAGAYAYVADNHGGLSVIHIGTPATPTLTGYYDTYGFSMDVALAGNVAYLANINELVIIDVTDPAAPIKVGGYETPLQLDKVAASGARVYVVAVSLHILDVSPTTLGARAGVAAVGDPLLLGTFTSPAGSANDVALLDHYAYLAEGQWEGPGGLRVLDIAEPTAPALIGSQNLSATSPWPLSVAAAGDLAFLGGQPGGLAVFDVADRAHPTLVGWFRGDQPWGTERVAARGNYAYAANGDAGLYIVDATDPAAPVAAGNLTVAAKGVALAGEYAYVCTRDALHVVNIADPGHATLMGSAALDGVGVGVGVGVAVARNYAFAATDSGLHVFDVADPTQPVQIGPATASGAGQAVAVAWPYAFVGSVRRMTVLDVSNPAAPQQVGFIAITMVRGIAVKAGRIYVAASQNGLYILRLAGWEPRTLFMPRVQHR